MKYPMSEDQNIECKSSWHDDYLKWICGFANSKPTLSM
jgi:ATP-dependent DNA helicase RecG